MAYWSIPAGQQIDYSANGDDIDSFSQKVKWSLEEIFNSLQYLHTNGSTGDIDAPAQAYEIRVDSSNGTLCIRNAANNDWITLGKLEEHFGIEPEDIGAIRNGGGIKKLDSGKLTIAELNAEHLEDYSTGDVYISAEGRAVYWFTGSTWKTIIASGDGSDILTKSILVNQGSEANAGKVLKINEHGKLSTDITGSPGMLYDKAIVKRGALKNNQVLVYDSTENGNAGAFVNREIDAVVGGGIGGGWNDSVVSTLQGSLTFKRNSGDTGYFGKYDGTADVTVLGSDLIGRLTLIQGESSVQYDGSRDATVKIPDRFIPYDLSITQNGQTSLYSGVSPVSITIPPFDTIPYDKYLTIRTKTGGRLVRYNGSEEVDVSLKPLTITQGKSTLEYDGGMAQEITIPSANQTLTIEKNSTKATYDGTKNAYIKLDNAKLVISQEGQEDIEYDGSAAKEITIPSGKTESLTITQGNSTLGTYDGSSVTSIAIQEGMIDSEKRMVDYQKVLMMQLYCSLMYAGIPITVYGLDRFRYVLFGRKEADIDTDTISGNITISSTTLERNLHTKGLLLSSEVASGTIETTVQSIPARLNVHHITAILVLDADLVVQTKVFLAHSTDIHITPTYQTMTLVPYEFNNVSHNTSIGTDEAGAEICVYTYDYVGDDIPTVFSFKIDVAHIAGYKFFDEFVYYFACMLDE